MFITTDKSNNTTFDTLLLHSTSRMRQHITCSLVLEWHDYQILDRTSYIDPDWIYENAHPRFPPNVTMSP